MPHEVNFVIDDTATSVVAAAAAALNAINVSPSTITGVVWTRNTAGPEELKVLSNIHQAVVETKVLSWSCSSVCDLTSLTEETLMEIKGQDVPGATFVFGEALARIPQTTAKNCAAAGLPDDAALVFHGFKSSLDLSRCTKLTKLPYACFKSFKGRSLLLPPSIESMRPWAFYGCSCSVDLSGCTKLTTVPGGCFKLFTGANITAPPKAFVFGEEAFAGCRASVDLSTAKHSAIEIAASCFAGFTGPSIVCPPGVSTLSMRAFSECKASVDLSHCLGLKKVPTLCFERFEGAMIRLPPSIVTLERLAFLSCGPGVSVSIPGDDLTTIGDGCFEKFGATSDMSHRLSVASTASGGSAAGGNLSPGEDRDPKTQGHTPTAGTPQHGPADAAATPPKKSVSVVTLNIPPSVVTIGRRAFRACHAAVDLSRCGALKEIQAETFLSFVGSSLLLPLSLNVIGASAFRACEASVDIRKNVGLKEVSRDAFEEFKGQEVKVPPKYKEIAGDTSGCVIM